MGVRIRTGAVLAVVTLAGVVPVGPSAARAETDGGAPATVSVRLDGLDGAVGAAGAEGPDGAGTLSVPTRAPMPFTMLALELGPEVGARVRTSADGTTWDPWIDMEVMEPDVGPDGGATEADAARPGGRRVTEATWVGPSRWLQVALDGGDPAEVDAVLIDSDGLSTGVRTSGGEPPDPTPAVSEQASRAAVARPAIISRREWGADESLRRGRPVVAPTARYAVVHHTAGSNSYTRAEAAAVVRGIYHYHTQSLGWDDIGYNILVDRYGRIFEGRAGGLDRAVVGAHAKGFNTGSIGVALLGEFTSSAPPTEGLGAVAAAIAWKFTVHGIGTAGTVRVVSGGSDRYAEGTVVDLPPIVGHRDVGRTACPGNAYYGQMGLLRRSVELRGAPSSPTKAAFSDIGDSVHAGAITTLAASRVTAGCGGGRYCPHARISRAEAVTLLHRALGRGDGSGQRFRDVPAGHTHARSIAAAVDAGTISGYPDGTFRPDATLRRDQMASLVARSAGLARVPGQHFGDVPWVSPHLANVNAIGKAGISNGCGGGNFCPERWVNRGQMASIIVRMLERR